MSRKPKHTPGPWKAHFNVLSARIGHIIKVDDHVQLPLCSVGSFFNKELGESEANARLMAAAPEMFAALKALLKWATTDKQKPGGSFSHLAEKVIPKADNAIRKATGGAK